jgi:UDP-N-acetylglucosamine--N-acetylmuramyl-(pentapeptide) pyrophosphoryl-undecaprenol N-acetylglucosamine transferase
MVIHESNLKSGSTNRIAASAAKLILCNDRECDLYQIYPEKSKVVATPTLQPGKTMLTTAKQTFFKEYKVRESVLYLLVFGGSQGSKTINDFIEQNRASLLEKHEDLTIIHLFGMGFPKKQIIVEERYLGIPYTNEIEALFAMATLSLNRAGGASCAELVKYRVPSIYVPYPHGNLEQYDNARMITESGGGYLLEDSKLSSEPKSVIELIEKILGSEDLREEMSSSLKNMGRKDSLDSFILEIEELSK